MTAEQLAALHRKCFTTPRPWRAEEFAGLLGSYGVFLETRPAGFALGRVIADEVELLTLAVEPALHRQGQGRALLRAFEQHARAQGARLAHLEVASDNHAALALYQAEGYRESGRRPDYYRTPEGDFRDALCLRKSLI
ncbi:MAG: ribosomal-protein-alanine acetyltransferase [Rhodobacterales bacterium]|nr:MAG: ribosomal-protein-alanine acetyltransferase [Rhodobacterales bacterium]